MNKKILIISPYFPPSNAADMQRVRTSLPYFKEFGWDATVVTVDEKYSDMTKDDLLLLSIPEDIKVYKVRALNKKWTSKIGLGSLALRSPWFYRQQVNALLRKGKYDLIYFSTTQFMICALGAYWKKRFGIPYVIDMQDPWYSTHYKDKPKDNRPSKYRLVYGLHKYLEAIAMKHVSGLISVSDGYINDLKARYPYLKLVPSATITFGAFEPDIKIATDNENKFKFLLQPGFKNIVYVGRGGADMHKAIIPVFEALKRGLANQPEQFNKLKFYFIGTSYAPAEKAIPTILPLAEKYGVDNSVVEITDRISYYHTLTTLKQADALLIPGADDPKYTASKIYPYLLTQKPLVAIFNEHSNAVAALNKCADAIVLTFDKEARHLTEPLYKIFTDWSNGLLKPTVLLPGFEEFSARNLTGKQTELFEHTTKHFETKDTNA